MEDFKIEITKGEKEYILFHGKVKLVSEKIEDLFGYIKTNL